MNLTIIYPSPDYTTLSKTFFSTINKKVFGNKLKWDTLYQDWNYLNQLIKISDLNHEFD